MKEPLLIIKDLRKKFGGVEAVATVSFEIPGGALVGLIGPNGAGKTTLVNLITKHETPDSGIVVLLGKEIQGLPTYKVARAGVCRTYQQNRLFMEESVEENVKTSMGWSRDKEGVSNGLSYVGIKGSKQARTEALLEFFGLIPYRDRLPGDLSHLVRKRIEIAQALAVGPKLLLLDEPFGGLTQEEAFDLIGLLRVCQKDGGLTILLIDHNMEVVMSVCEYLYVLHHGALIATGTPEEIRSNERVSRVYLAGDL